jgi:hypothetical protein
VFSCNVPVPPAVGRVASDLAAEIPEARERPRGRHTLLAKRLDPEVEAGPGDPTHRLDARLREALAGTAPFAVRIGGVDLFADPPTGAGPVVYLAVEGPGLFALHERLCEAFPTVDGLEGEGYVPHVTVARGGDPDLADALTDRDVDPVEWTVETLELYDANRHLPVSEISLPV